MFAIETEDLTKSYDGFAVLRGLTMRVESGQVYGLLGPNGTGKSTLIHLLLGFLKPDRGTLRVLGSADLEAARGRVGYLPERLRYHLRYSAREYMRYLGRFSDLREPQLSARADEDLRTVGLLEAADRQLSTYSKGMLQRFGIAQALLADPDLLLIDEPTSGLDPAGQREMLDLLAALRGRGHTIFLTTHILDEAEQLCDRIGVLFGGKLAAEVEAQSLRGPGSGVLIRVADLPPELAQQLQRLAPAVHCSGREISVRPNTPELQSQVLRVLVDTNTPIIGIETRGRPLEEIYMRIMRGETLPPPADEPPPNSLFAPPDHPDAAPHALPGRPGSGDTLLRELLSQEPEQDQEKRA